MKHSYCLGNLIQRFKRYGFKYLVCYPFDDYKNAADLNDCFDYKIVGLCTGKDVYKKIDEMYPDAVTFILDNC